MSYSDNYSSSIEIDSDFSMFETEMVGGEKSIPTEDLKQIVLLSTKIIANNVKRYHLKGFFKIFNSEKKFMDNYHKLLGKFLINQELSNLNDRKRLKNILNLNIITLIEFKELLKKNNITIKELKPLSEVIKKLLNKFSN